MSAAVQLLCAPVVLRAVCCLTTSTAHVQPHAGTCTATHLQPAALLLTCCLAPLRRRFSGPTVHFVDEEFDTGPILAQRVVPVYPTDTPEQLACRVLQQEHLVYPEAVAALVEGRVTWREDGIPIMWSAH
jgi:hypothetical protein